MSDEGGLPYVSYETFGRQFFDVAVSEERVLGGVNVMARPARRLRADRGRSGTDRPGHRARCDRSGDPAGSWSAIGPKGGDPTVSGDFAEAAQAELSQAELCATDAPTV